MQLAPEPQGNRVYCRPKGGRISSTIEWRYACRFRFPPLHRRSGLISSTTQCPVAPARPGGRVKTTEPGKPAGSAGRLFVSHEAPIDMGICPALTTGLIEAQVVGIADAY